MSNEAIKNHMVALKVFEDQFKAITVDFNDLVIESVKLLWEHEQIAVVNRTMDTLQHMKGADNRALVTFYKKVIPHVFDGETGRFTKKNPKMVEKMVDMYMDYLLEHNWYEFSKTKDSKPYELDIANILKLVESKLTKGKDSDSGDQVTNDKLDQLAKGMNAILEKFEVEVAETEVEVETEEARGDRMDENISKLLNDIKAA